MPDCPTGKISYPSPSDAIRAIRGLTRRHRKQHGAIEGHWYRCPTCHHYHLARPRPKRLP